MDYSYFGPPAQPYQFFGIAPTKPELPYTRQEEPQNDPDIYDPNTFQFFDQNARFNSTALIPSTQSSSLSIHRTESLPHPLSLPYDRSLSQDLIGDVDMDHAPGRGSSDDDKDNLTPAQSRRKAQNRAAQRAFRERKERHVKNLELKLKSMDTHSTGLMTENERLKRELDRIATQNEILRATNTPRRAPHHEQSHNAHHEGPSSPEGLTSGPMIYSPSTFNAAFAEHHTSDPEEPVSHRIEISATTGERLLATGAAWDFIQHHELYRRGLVDIADVSEKLKEKVAIVYCPRSLRATTPPSIARNENVTPLKVHIPNLPYRAHPPSEPAKTTNQHVPRPSMPVTEGQKPDTATPIEQIEQASRSSMPLAERQKSNETVPLEGEKPSKNALKKAAKEKEKAEKAAKREQQEREEKEKAAANDTASHLYGHLNYEAPPPFAEKFLDLGDLEGIEENSRVTFEARVGNARVQSAKLGFLVLRDGFDSIQVVIAEGGPQKISRQMIKWCGGLNTESIVRVTGLVQAPKEEVKSATISHHELHLDSIYVVAEAPEQLPVQVKDCNQPPPGEEEGDAVIEGLPNVGLKARLDNKVLSLRAPAGEAIIKLESEVTRLFNEYMFQHKFTDIQPSYLAGAATEGGAGVFEVKYFEEKAFLTQSPQFFKQMTIAGGMKRVFSVGPVFRAENSNTRRHLTEFTGLDFEMTIRHHYHEVLSFGESLMIYIIRGLQTQEYPKKLTNIIREAGYPEAGTFQLPPGDKAVRITFAEAKALLSEAGIEGGEPHSDIDTAQEKALGKIILEKYKTDFYTVDEFPRSLRPFYTHPSPKDPALTNSYDFFMRGQEFMSGAQRIHNYNDLCESMRLKGLSPEDEGFKHYTEAFKWGCSPHGGGGLGLNRIVQSFLGLNNIREATLFPRDPGRLAP